MGGALFSKKRLSKDEFEDLLNGLQSELNKAFETIRYPAFDLVPYYRDKKDFGDVDIVVKCDVGTVRDAIIKHFGFASSEKLIRKKYSTNDNVFSFQYKDFQVDLICTVDNYETSLNFFSYNDVGNLLGRFYHKFGLKFGHEGLLFPIRDETGKIRKELVVTKDIKQILGFLGLDFEVWNNSFDKLEDMFEWISKTKYFDAEIFDEENWSSINVKRNNKRSTFSSFIKWIKTNKTKSNYTFLKREERENYIPLIEKYFGVDIQTELKLLKEKFELEREIKTKFNGVLTGLKGKELGDFMNQFVKEYGGWKDKKIHSNFNDYILYNTFEKINDDILEFKKDGYCFINYE